MKITETLGRCHVEGLTNGLAEYINEFSRTRHVKLDNKKIKSCDPEWKNHSFNGNLGKDGAYYVSPELIGREPFVTDHLLQPDGVPGFNCHWTVNTEGDLVWNGAERFTSHVSWLQYLIDNFFAPSGAVLNGIFLVSCPEDKFGISTYVVVSENIVEEICANDAQANDKIESLYSDNETVMEIFNEIRVNPSDVEEYWKRTT